MSETLLAIAAGIAISHFAHNKEKKTKQIKSKKTKDYKNGSKS
jgi:hypothetical protein